jgi:dTDP-4-dehydrorhamnose reductase
MNKPRLLLTGASGFLGYNFLQQDLSAWDVFAITNQRKYSFVNAQPVNSNIAHEQLIKEAFNYVNPHAVIHLAAISNANFCEEHEGLSNQINVNATVLLAQLCAEKNIPFVFTSTDLVFDGQQGNYTENALVNPLSIYGKQKAEAEQRVFEVYPNACVLRMPLMFGNGGLYAQSFMQPFLYKLQQGDSLQLFTDEYRSVVGGGSAAGGILLALENNWQGLYHLGGKERLSRYDFGLLLCNAFGINPSLIIPTLQKEVKMAAPRPPDVSLNSTKAFALGYNPRLVVEELLGVVE